jgi:Holliday junction resolvase
MNACQKGKRGEREWRDFLRSLGLEARRGRQFSGSPESPDVVGGFIDTHCEVKRVEALNIYDAIAQAVRDSGNATPYVAHRKNGKDWLITIRATDVHAFATSVVSSLGWPITTTK